MVTMQPRLFKRSILPQITQSVATKWPRHHKNLSFQIRRLYCALSPFRHVERTIHTFLTISSSRASMHMIVGTGIGISVICICIAQIRTISVAETLLCYWVVGVVSAHALSTLATLTLESSWESLVLLRHRPSARLLALVLLSSVVCAA